MMNDLLPAFQRAIALHGKGRVREAQEIYESVLKCDASHFDSLFHLGSIRLQQNHYADAEALFRRAVKIDKRSADAQHHLAIALTGLQRLDEAVTHYLRALDLKPRDAVAHNNLGYVLQKLDRHKEAVKPYRKALSINPYYPEAHNNLGNALQLLDRTEEAIEHYRQALAIRPNDAGAHNNLASALAALNRHGEAIKHCDTALALAPNNAEVRLNLANSLGATERFEDALAHYQKAIAIDQTNVEAHARASVLLFLLGRVQEAIAYCEKALSNKANHVQALGTMGRALCALGKVDEAIRSFEKAIAEEPKKAASQYYNLVICKRICASDPHFQAMQRLAREMETFDLTNQMCLHFALGKAYADVGDHRRSFRHVSKGNALKRKEFVEHDESKCLMQFARIAAVFTAELLAEKKNFGDPSPLPVFIFGMPRSGTSLVEQILASHPKVFGAGERREFGELADSIVKSPEAVANISKEQLRALGARYVRAIQPLAPEADRIIDKMPENFFDAGLIHIALPNARIIHIRRDPRDTALSCFSTLFMVGHAHTYDLAELGRYMRAYEDLMQHWREALPAGAMIEVQYEELVEHLEREAKRIVEYCGLDWDDACLSFHNNKRPVRTASVMQVRQPIYNSSVGRWRLYEKELEPFWRAYSAA